MSVSTAEPGNAGPAEQATKDADEATAAAATAATAQATADTEAAASTGFKAITTQDELNKILQPRVERERAKFADYDALKADAEKAKTDLVAERTARATAETENAELKGVKSLEDARAAAAKTAGIDPAFLADTPLDRLEARATELASKLPKGAAGPYVPTEGKPTTAVPEVKPGMGTLRLAYANASAKTTN